MILFLAMYIDPMLSLNKGEYRVLMELNGSSFVDSLYALGLDVHTVLDRFVSAEVDSSDLVTLEGKTFVKRIEMAKPVEFFNDKGKELVGLTSLEPLQQYGGDVMVGIIDQGIDLSHPGFFDDGYTLFSGVWDQTANTFNPPHGFNFGRWYSKEEISLNPPDLDETGHGTGISGTIMGRDSIYSGVLKKGEFYFVKIISDEMGVIDAFSFLVQKAESLDIPLVINMSLGHRFGPHNGNTLFERFLSEMIKNSSIRVIPVASAGNYGGSFIHAGGFTGFGDSASNEIDSTDFFLVNLSSEDSLIFISIFCPKNSQQSFRISVNNQWITGWMGDTIFMEKYGLPYFLDSLLIFSGAYDSTYHSISILIFQKKGYADNVLTVNLFGDIGVRIDGWISYGRSRFMNSEGIYKRGFKPEDRYQIGPPGSSPNVVTAGAFTSRTQWISINGETVDKGGKIYEPAVWSSRGSIADIVKPDFLLPGRFIITLNSGDLCCNDNMIIDRLRYAGYGTSFSSAFLTGAIALLLSFNPDGDVVQSLKLSASNYTSPDSLYGYGIPDVRAAANIVSFGVALLDFQIKSDNGNIEVFWKQGSVVSNGEWVIERNGEVVYSSPVLAGVKTCIYRETVKPGRYNYKLILRKGLSDTTLAQKNVYAYPDNLSIVNNLFSLTFYPNGEKSKIEIYDISGKLIKKLELENNTVVFYPPSSGMYFVKYGEGVKKFLLIK